MPDNPPSLRNWGGNVTYGATRLHRPTTLDELRRTVAGSPRIRALGSGHSFSLVGDTTAELVRLDRMPDTVRIDATARTVQVSAGTNYAHLADTLHRAGFALSNLASLPHISVAGSCATGTHGSGETQRSLAAAVRAVQLIGADGDLVELDRNNDPDTFPGAVVALGGLGVVTRLTLDIELAYEVAQRVMVDVPLEEIETRLGDVFTAAYSVSVFTSWRTGRANVFLKRRTDRPAGAWAAGRPATAPVHPVPEQSPENCTEQFDRPGPWHERLPHFRPGYVPGSGAELQAEYFLPREHAAAAIAALRPLGDLMAPVLQISELRMVRGDDLWLSPAYGRDSMTVHFTWVEDLAAVVPVLSAVEEQLRPFQPRPHWGKLTLMSPGEIIASYPRAADFAKLAETMDPTGKFGNSYLEALFPAA